MVNSQNRISIIKKSFNILFNFAEFYESCGSYGSMNGIEIVVDGRTGKPVLIQGYPK